MKLYKQLCEDCCVMSCILYCNVSRFSSSRSRSLLDFSRWRAPCERTTKLEGVPVPPFSCLSRSWAEEELCAQSEGVLIGVRGLNSTASSLEVALTHQDPSVTFMPRLFRSLIVIGSKARVRHARYMHDGLSCLRTYR